MGMNENEELRAEVERLTRQWFYEHDLRAVAEAELRALWEGIKALADEFGARSVECSEEADTCTERDDDGGAREWGEGAAVYRHAERDVHALLAPSEQPAPLVCAAGISDPVPAATTGEAAPRGLISRMVCECCSAGCDCGCVADCPAPDCRKVPAPVSSGEAEADPWVAEETAHGTIHRCRHCQGVNDWTGHRTDCPVYRAADARSQAARGIAPVSSGEAGAGEASMPAEIVCSHGVPSADRDHRCADEPAEACPPSQRKDGRHSWKFDGDDPHIICHYCDEMRDSLTGRVIRPAPVVAPSAEGGA